MYDLPSKRREKCQDRQPVSYALGPDDILQKESWAQFPTCTSYRHQHLIPDELAYARVTVLDGQRSASHYEYEASKDHGRADVQPSGYDHPQQDRSDTHSHDQR